MSYLLNQRPRVLMFAPAFAPHFFSEALVNSKLALAFIDAGCEVVAFAAPGGGEVYSSNWNEPWSRLRNVRRDASVEQYGGLVAQVARLGAAVRSGHPVGSAYWAQRTAQAAVQQHSERPFELVLSRSTSCIAHLPAMLFRRALRSAAPIWIANWNDPPSHLFPPPYRYRLAGPKRYFIDRYLQSAAAVADINTFPSEQLRDYLTEPLQLNAADTPELRRGLVIPHIGMGWTPRYQLATTDPMRFRICHAGNLSTERDPTLLFRALARVAKRRPEIRFEIEIIGRLDPTFETTAVELGLGGAIRKVDGLPFLDCLNRLSQSDLQVLIEAPCQRGVFLPSKLIDYIEVGQPILALSPRIGAVRDLITRHGFGLFAANDSQTDIEAALEVALNERSCPQRMHARQDALRSMAALIHPRRIVDETIRAARQIRRDA